MVLKELPDDGVVVDACAGRLLLPEFLYEDVGLGGGEGVVGGREDRVGLAAAEEDVVAAGLHYACEVGEVWLCGDGIPQSAALLGGGGGVVVVAPGIVAGCEG